MTRVDKQLILLDRITYDSGEKGLYVWIAYGLNFYMTQKSRDWVSTAHFYKGYENYVAQ